jgi:phage gpG-like protein
VSLQVEVTQKGAGKAALNLHRLGERARQNRPAARKVDRVIARSEKDRFAKEGPGWPDLAASTRARKEREGLPTEILRASGALYRSLTEGGSDHVDTWTPDEFRFGTEVPYAVYHDVGQGVPKRKLIELTVSDRRRITEAIADWVVDGDAL